MDQGLFNKKITQIEDNIFEVEGLRKGEYDVQAIQYDRLISNGLYNRIMWGNAPDAYTDFCKSGLESLNDGIVADIGCGTLSFTYKAYAEHHKKNIFLCDQSYEMLKIGENRLSNICDDLSTIKFLRSNALDMPFKENSVQAVLTFGLFHVFKNPSGLICEIARILLPEGQLFLTSLCTDRKLSAKYLNFLHKKGHVAKPLSSIEIKNIIEENGIKVSGFNVKGGMAYISGTKDKS
ncbi:MAG: class I SAM-dependent methyltransferase [Chlorobi bacterium]|nr:class I SAM-dependent methyltransferase [Chlorobiota bacterium]